MSGKITDLTNMNGSASIDRAADLLEIVDLSGNASYKATPNFILGFTGGNPVSTSDTQVLTNKTLTTPTISDPVLSGTITGTYTIAGTPTFPSAVVTLTGSQTLTNKTLTSPTVNGGTIDNATVTVDSIAEHTASNGVTVGGVNLKSGILNTNNAVVTASIASGAVTAAKLATAPSRFVIVNPAVVLIDINPAATAWVALDITSNTSVTATAAMIKMGVSGAAVNVGGYARKTGTADGQDNTTIITNTQVADSATKAWSSASVALDASQSFDYSAGNANLNAQTIVLIGYWETVA